MSSVAVCHTSSKSSDSQTNFSSKYLLGFVSPDKHHCLFHAHTHCSIPDPYFLFNSFTFSQHIVGFLSFSICEFHRMENQARHMQYMKLVCLPKWLIKLNQEQFQTAEGIIKLYISCL